ncbi:hypothetical protein GCM10011507_00510 [Edaphobacter acidisoli]|uniref:N-acetylmuramoyl-L-alanine amidase n=1 Tax=Edaphobacter acidisoli TaxID=2040573 RepID=A0A916RDJ3_9BACT|nr:N-acetylmuramoyl-L-alanine amidase [Edaphobacter acidisoli]GGA53347.1 hypothetical protein GCM10011507_00510 [Edaphobacter acidisoli]
MLPRRRHIAALLLLVATATFAQQPRSTILLDPAHGGPDSGAHLANNVLEKDVTLAFAARLRASLTAAGLAVATTRDIDPGTVMAADLRAGIANHARPAACILIHATDSGNGVHIITSALPATNTQPRIIPWNTAQAAFIPQSLALANQAGAALTRANLPVLVEQASVRPIDNLTCPAIAIEIAPLGNPSNPDELTPVTDAAYQQRIADAVAKAVAAWRSQPAAPVIEDTGAAQ